MATVTQDGQATEIWFTPSLSDWTPTGLTAKSDRKKIFLSWNIPVVNGVVHPDMRGYRIFHSTDDSTFNLISVINKNFPRAMTFFPDLDPGTHYFKIATVFKHEYASPLSASVSVVHGENYGN